MIPTFAVLIGRISTLCVNRSILTVGIKEFIIHKDCRNEHVLTVLFLEINLTLKKKTLKWALLHYLKGQQETTI